VQIFERAFERLESYPVAPYAVFIDTWHQTATGGGSTPIDNVLVFRYAVRMSDGGENSAPYPVLNGRLPPAMIGKQFQGPFAWSLRARRAQTHAPAMLQPDLPEPYRVIAHVVVHEPLHYAVDPPLLETLDGHRVYDLRLRPLSDPQRYNLREIWVDTSTFDIWKAHFEGTYQPTPSTMESPSDVTVTFVPVGPYWIVHRMQWTWEDYQNSRFFHFDATTNEIAFPCSLPGWLFDERAYGRRENAHQADPLDAIVNGAAVTC
jgi:hypothetical protein